MASTSAAPDLGASNPGGSRRKIKGIIEPRLADQVRRKALKLLNELKRAV